MMPERPPASVSSPARSPRRSQSSVSALATAPGGVIPGFLKLIGGQIQSWAASAHSAVLQFMLASDKCLSNNCMPTFVADDHQTPAAHRLGHKCGINVTSSCAEYGQTIFLHSGCSPGFLKLVGGQIQARLPQGHSVTLQAEPIASKALAQRVHICRTRPEGFCPEAFCRGGFCPEGLGRLGLGEPGEQGGAGNRGLLGLPPGGCLGELQVLQGRGGGWESAASKRLGWRQNAPGSRYRGRVAGPGHRVEGRRASAC